VGDELKPAEAKYMSDARRKREREQKKRIGNVIRMDKETEQLEVSGLSSA